MTGAQRNIMVALAAVVVVVAIFAMTAACPRRAYRIYAGDDTYLGYVTEGRAAHVIHTTDGRTIEYQGTIVTVTEE